MASSVSRRLWVAGIAACWWAAVLPATADAQGGRQVTMEDVWDAWSARQKRAEKCRLTYTTQQTYTEGCEGAPPTGGPRGPYKDTTVTEKHEISLSGASFRHTMDGPHWSLEKGRFFDYKHVCTFDGVRDKRFYPCPEENNGRLHGRDGKHEVPFEAGGMFTMPLLIPLRGMHLKLSGIDIRQFTVASQSVNLDRLPCVLLRWEQNNDLILMWVAPQRDFLPVRYEYKDVKGKESPWIVTTFTHRQDPKCGWIPATWKLVNHYAQPGGKLRKSAITTLASCSFDPTFAPDEFDFQFPPGTVVDATDGDGIGYIVRPNGSKEPRKLATPEMQAEWERARGQRPPEADPAVEPPKSRKGWLAGTAVGAALATVAVGGVWVRKRRRSASAEPAGAA